MTTRNVRDAQAHLPDLAVRPRTFGTLRRAVPDAFLEPLDEQELAAWE